MPIVSISFPEKMLKEMDDIEEALEFSGRSELVRASVRLLLQDHREKKAMSGTGSAVVVVTHTEENEAPVTRIKHQFDGIIRTHIHNKTERGNCVELFLLEGQARSIASMTEEFQKEDKIRSVRLVKL